MKRRISISFISLLVILSIILSGCANMAQKETSEPRVETAVQEHVDQENVAGTRAQDDFYEYVNGKIIEEKSREPENQGWDHFASLYDRVTDDLNIIAEELKSQADKFDKGSVEKAVADLFQTSLDFEGREKAGLGGLAPYLEAMESAQSVEEYLDVLAMIRKDLGKASLMTLVPSADPKDSSKYALFFDEPNLLMEKEDFDDELAVEDMKVYLASLLEAYGMEKQDAKEWGEKVFDLCKDFADAALSKVERSNVEQTTNYYTDEELQAALTNVDVKKFFASSAQDQYATKVIQDPAMVEKINAYLSGEHLELLKKYSLVSLLHDFAPYLNNEFVQASARFQQMDDADPDMTAWDSVQTLAEFEIGDMYAKRFFSPEKKVAVEKMVQDILAGYKSHIDGLDWLSEEISQRRRKK